MTAAFRGSRHLSGLGLRNAMISRDPPALEPTPSGFTPSLARWLVLCVHRIVGVRVGPRRGSCGDRTVADEYGWKRSTAPKPRNAHPCVRTHTRYRVRYACQTDRLLRIHRA